MKMEVARTSQTIFSEFIMLKCKGPKEQSYICSEKIGELINFDNMG